MKNYNLIDNIFIKFFLFFLIINVIFEHEYHKKEFNDLEYYFSQSVCQFLFFAINYNCSINFFLNNNIYNDILEINSNVNLLINIKKSRLENIFLLLGIIPFLKKNSTLSYKINNKGIYKFFKNIMKEKMKNKIIKFGSNDLHSFNKIMTKLLYYNWELIPKKLILDHFRYIVNNYYIDSNSILFQKSLNMVYKSYIHNKRNEMTYDELTNLLSKLIIINFI
jgi:hypothetical protein